MTRDVSRTLITSSLALN